MQQHEIAGQLGPPEQVGDDLDDADTGDDGKGCEAEGKVQLLDADPLLKLQLQPAGLAIHVDQIGGQGPEQIDPSYRPQRAGFRHTGEVLGAGS